MSRNPLSDTAVLTSEPAWSGHPWNDTLTTSKVEQTLWAPHLTARQGGTMGGIWVTPNLCDYRTVFRKRSSCTLWQWQYCRNAADTMVGMKSMRWKTLTSKENPLQLLALQTPIQGSTLLAIWERQHQSEGTCLHNVFSAVSRILKDLVGFLVIEATPSSASGRIWISDQKEKMHLALLLP